MSREFPYNLGFRMPAEWEPHEATWLSWPHNESDWPGKFEPIPAVYADIVAKLSHVEKVRILCGGLDVDETIRPLLADAGADLHAVEFWTQPTDRSWTRDFCPIFLKHGQGEVALTDWRFNAWAKYDDWQRDDAVPEAVAAQLGLQRFEPFHNGRRVVLEGGSIEVSGSGLMLTTEECLLSEVQCRNPGFTRGDYETVFRQYFGCEKTIWLRNGIAGDDTHGHIDDLARFVDPQTIVVAQEVDPVDDNYAVLQENLALLHEARDQHNRPFRVVALPMPRPVVFAGQRLPASYANFYIANQTVLVPTFNDPADRIALNTLAELFPGRTVVGIHSLDLVLGLGTLHCMTQQQPAA